MLEVENAEMRKCRDTPGTDWRGRWGTKYTRTTFEVSIGVLSN